MDLLKFIQEFPDEAACRQKFKDERDKIGVHILWRLEASHGIPYIKGDKTRILIILSK